MKSASFFVYSFRCPLSQFPIVPSLFVGHLPFVSRNSLSSSSRSSHVTRAGRTDHGKEMESSRSTRSSVRWVLLFVFAVPFFGAVVAEDDVVASAFPSSASSFATSVSAFAFTMISSVTTPSSASSVSRSSPRPCSCLFLFARSSATQRPSPGCFWGGPACPFTSLYATNLWNRTSKSSFLHACFSLVFFGAVVPSSDAAGDMFFSTTLFRSSGSSALSKNGNSFLGEASSMHTTLTLPLLLSSSPSPSCALTPHPTFLSFSSSSGLNDPSNLANSALNAGTLTPAAPTCLLPACPVSISVSSSCSHAK
mmetsp:Transcript_35676/g.86076  ORF Transcript_35676/g.86076 Transcript_35676/m.86076 type:complete len:309 (-) Transcript_35676:249-1175(-)